MFLLFSISGQIGFTQVVFKDPNEQSTKKIFGDKSNRTTDNSQAIYEEGGENARYRITETEKGLNYVKNELANLKTEVSNLKLQIEELKKQAPSSNKVNFEPTPSTMPRKKPTPY